MCCFRPTGWYDGKQYFALVGNRSFAPEHDGDCSSLMTAERRLRISFRGGRRTAGRRARNFGLHSGQDNYLCFDGHVLSARKGTYTLYGAKEGFWRSITAP